MANGWGVYTLSGVLAFDVDSCLDLKFGAKAKTSDFPVEEGAFASYNKVLDPFAPKVRLVVGGPARIAAFQVALHAALASASLFNIVTPTLTYLNVTLEGYDHDQTAENGALSLLVVDLAYKQVREVAPAYSSLPAAKAKNPSAASKVVGGKVQPQTPAKPPSPPWSTLMADANTAAGE